VRETIGDKEEQVKKLTGENQENAAEIEKLTAEITTNQQTITQLQNDLADINARLKRQENGFLAAFTLLKQRLQTDAGKIRSYLGPVESSGPPRKK
jgi:chromosome segregation ATPase